MRWNLLVVFLAVLVFLTSAARPMPLRETWEEIPPGGYADGQAIGLTWTNAWNGGGGTRVISTGDRGQVLQLVPGFTSNRETHSALTISGPVFGDSDTSVDLRTVRQVKGEPQPWEVGWLLVHHQRDSCNNSIFYYLILKQSHGWELGKTYSDASCTLLQHFIATGDGAFPIGQWYTPRVVTEGGTIVAYNGNTVLGSGIDDGTHGPVYTAGAVGFYTEDAEVQFDSVTVSR